MRRCILCNDQLKMMPILVLFSHRCQDDTTNLWSCAEYWNLGPETWLRSFVTFPRNKTKVATVPSPPSRSFRRLIGRVKWIIGRNFKSFEMTEADSLQSKLLWSLKWVGQLLTIFNVACDSFTAWVLIYTFYCLKVLGITGPGKLWQIFAIVTIQLNVDHEYKKLFYHAW